MNPRWFPSNVRNSKAEDKESYERMVRGGTDALRRLKEIINEDVNALEAPKSFDDYSPGWEYKQADRLGQIRVYRNLLTLLEFIDDRTIPSRPRR